MKQLPGCFPDEATYSSVMRILCKVNRVDEATELLDEMISFGLVPNTVTFNVLIDGLGRSGKLKKMEKMCERMQKSFLKHNVQTYNSLIYTYGKWGHIEKMEDSFEKMQLDNCHPDHITFTCMIESYAKWELHEKMYNTLIHMIRMKYKMTIAIFNTVLYALGNANKIDEMERIHKLFHTLHLKRNYKTISALVNGYGVAKRREKIMQLLKKLTSWQLNLDEIAYNDVVIALCNCNAFDEVKKVIKDMKSAGFKPNSSAISALILAYAREGPLEEMQRIYLAAKNEGVNFCLTIYNAILSAHGRERNLVGVQDVWEDIFRAGLEPDSSSFSELVSAFANSGKLGEMENTFLQMKGSNLLASETCLVSLLKAYAESDRVSEMENIWNILQGGNFKWTPQVVDILIGCYSRNGMMEKSEDILSQFVKKDGIPDWESYSSILIGYGFEALVDEIYGEVSTTAATRLPADLKLISHLFWALSACKSNREYELVVLWISEFASGFYKPLISVLVSEAPADEIVEILSFRKIATILDEMHSRMRNPPILRHVYSGLVSTLWNYGLKRRSLRLIEDGKLRGIFPIHIDMDPDSQRWTADFNYLPKLAAEISFYKWLQTCFEYIQRYENNNKEVPEPASAAIVLHSCTIRGKDGERFLAPKEGGSALETILKDLHSPFAHEENSLGAVVVADGNQFFAWVRSLFDSGKLEKRFENASDFGPGWKSPSIPATPVASDSK